MLPTLATTHKPTFIGTPAEIENDVKSVRLYLASNPTFEHAKSIEKSLVKNIEGRILKDGWTIESSEHSIYTQDITPRSGQEKLLRYKPNKKFNLMVKNT